MYQYSPIRFTVDCSNDYAVTLVAADLSSWEHLDRIYQLNLLLGGRYRYRQTGSDADVYIFDSGSSFFHTDCDGSSVCGLDAFGGNCADGQGACDTHSRDCVNLY
jgi:hypothetical protein